MKRLFCTTTYVLNPARSRTLLIHHRKLKRWVAPGGRMEADELPDESACREVEEETGLRVVLAGPRRAWLGDVVQPQGIQRDTVAQGKLEHLDLIYYAIVDESAPLRFNPVETLGIRWFPVAEVLAPDMETFDTTRRWLRFFRSQEAFGTR